MLNTYKAILRGNQLEWIEIPPPANTQSLLVHVTLLEQAPHVVASVETSANMMAILEQLAQASGVPGIADPVAWQREQRQERTLPDREG